MSETSLGEKVKDDGGGASDRLTKETAIKHKEKGKINEYFTNMIISGHHCIKFNSVSVCWGERCQQSSLRGFAENVRLQGILCVQARAYIFAEMPTSEKVSRSILRSSDGSLHLLGLCRRSRRCPFFPPSRLCNLTIFL